jgi:hypothetical protein
VSGNFCHQCGQETVLHPPSTREFLHEFIGHYVALEGKLLQTMKLLLLKPGQLTLEYMRGRRVRYIQPLRVYLTFSLIFFAVFKFMGEDHHIGSKKVDAVPVIQVDEQDKENARARKQARDKVSDAGQVRAELSKDKALKDLNEEHPGIVETIEKVASATADDDGAKFKKAFFGYAPYAVFAMMPLFALYLKVLYLGSGKRYGEHLLFALHTNAFAFLMLTLLLLLPAFIPYVGTLLFLWLAFYLPIAMRRVYGGRRRTTFLRWTVLMLLHITSMAAAIAVVVYKGAGI